MQNHAVIIGAGIAGLAAAAALRGIGWRVSLYEQAGAPAPGGTALGMWPQAMQALDSIGAGDEVRRNSTLCHGATIVDPRGEPLARIPSTRSAYLISREQLVNILLAQVPAECIHWSHPWTPAEAWPEADLVVGADGIHSAVRARMWGGDSERPMHTVAFRGVIAHEVESVTETWGRGALFGITPTGDGQTNWFAYVRHDSLDDRDADDAQTLRRLFSQWHRPVSAIVEQLKPSDIDRRELSDISLKHAYARGDCVLVGDAAHAMAPNLGRGACESLVDATALAHALESSSPISAGLRNYDRVRRRATRRIVSLARGLNRIATTVRGARTRDRLVRLVLRP